MEHIWKVIGVASTCTTMDELRYRMRELYGDRDTYQLRMQLVPTPTRPALPSGPAAPNEQPQLF